MPQKANIAILIPCYNEELTVGSVIRDFHAALPEADIYVYDNNSTDNTRAAAEATNIAVVRHAPIQGKGAVVRQMLTEISADYYILVDGDATYDSSGVNNMLWMMREQDLDMIVGDRSKSFEGEKWTHAFGNRLVDRMIRIKFGNKNVVDTMSGLRIFTRNIAEEFRKDIRHDGFEIETEMTLWCVTRGYNIGSWIIPYHKRPKGSVSKLNTFKDGWRIIKLILKTRR